MATLTHTGPISSRRMRWLTNLLLEELAPFPGRLSLVARMVFAASLVMVINMTFQIPFGAYGAVYALILSREHPQVTVQAAKTMFVSFSIAAAYVLVGATVFAGDPTLRLLWVLVTLFLIFFAMSAVSNYTAAARFGYLLVITIPVWDRPITPEQKVVQTLWAVWAISFATGITALIELIYHRLRPTDSITSALVERLQDVSQLLRCWSTFSDRSQSERKVMHLAIVGTSRMRQDLLRSEYSLEQTEQFGALIALVGRIVDLADNLRFFSAAMTDADARRIDALASSVETLAEGVLNRQIPHETALRADSSAADQMPVLLEMETTALLIQEILSGSDAHTGYHPAPKRKQAGSRFFVPDAFSNSEYIRFAIRASLAGIVCYLIYNLIDWPGIGTAVTTCLLTALSTVGASRQKQILRFGGAVFGGVVLGFGAQVFILPQIDSIIGFLILFVAVSFVSAWIVTAGPRLSYFGVQVAVAFYLINLQEFKFQTSLALARDRVAGILLGLVAMWLIFDQLWEAPAIREMQDTFVHTLRSLAELMRAPRSNDPESALEETHRIRDRISVNFEALRQQADGVLLEFGRTREHNLALRARLMHWQLRLREVFRLRIGLLKYRLHLPGFELAQSDELNQEAFDIEIANRLDAIANRISGSVPIRSGKTSLDSEQVQKSAQYLRFENEWSMPAMRTFIPLSQRLERAVALLEEQVLLAATEAPARAESDAEFGTMQLKISKGT